MNGIEFAEMVRSAHDSPCPFVPIVMVSAHGEVAKVKKARMRASMSFSSSRSRRGLFTPGSVKSSPSRGFSFVRTNSSVPTAAAGPATTATRNAAALNPNRCAPKRICFLPNQYRFNRIQHFRNDHRFRQVAVKTGLKALVDIVLGRRRAQSKNRNLGRHSILF